MFFECEIDMKIYMNQNNEGAKHIGNMKLYRPCKYLSYFQETLGRRNLLQYFFSRFDVPFRGFFNIANGQFNNNGQFYNNRN